MKSRYKSNGRMATGETNANMMANYSWTLKWVCVMEPFSRNIY